MDNKISLDMNAKIFIYLGMRAEAETHVPDVVLKNKVNKLLSKLKVSNHIDYLQLMDALKNYKLDVRKY